MIFGSYLFENFLLTLVMQSTVTLNLLRSWRFLWMKRPNHFFFFFFSHPPSIPMIFNWLHLFPWKEFWCSQGQCTGCCLSAVFEIGFMSVSLENKIWVGSPPPESDVAGPWFLCSLTNLGGIIFYCKWMAWNVLTKMYWQGKVVFVSAQS